MTQILSIFITFFENRPGKTSNNFSLEPVPNNMLDINYTTNIVAMPVNQNNGQNIINTDTKSEYFLTKDSSVKSEYATENKVKTEVSRHISRHVRLICKRYYFYRSQ